MNEEKFCHVILQLFLWCVSYNIHIIRQRINVFNITYKNTKFVLDFHLIQILQKILRLVWNLVRKKQLLLSYFLCHSMFMLHVLNAIKIYVYCISENYHMNRFVRTFIHWYIQYIKIVNFFCYLSYTLLLQIEIEHPNELHDDDDGNSSKMLQQMY